jgi:remodeling and spacing factor 1
VFQLTFPFILGYLYSDVSIKLRIIKHLLEGQFDINAKFKNLINAKPSSSLRLEPFGRDKDGNVYYCQMDEKANIKIYQENLDEETWSVVASNRDELVKLIDELKGNKTIRPFPKDLIDEDSSSNSRPSDKDTETKTEEVPVETVEDPQQEEVETPTKVEKETEKVVQKKRRRK